MIETILFDLDGTLTDPAEGITNSVAYALNRYGITVSDKRALNCFIGPPLAESFTRYFPFSKEKALEAVEVYREYFREQGIFENRVYDGIPQMLASLCEAGKRLVLATSKPEIFAKQILEHFSLADHFAFVAGSELDHRRVDKHEVIEYALASVGLADRDTAIMVGDRMHDVRGAKASSLVSIGVTYGYGSEEELLSAGADHTVNTVGELHSLLMKI